MCRKKIQRIFRKKRNSGKKKKAKTILALSLLVKSLGKFSGWEVFLFFFFRKMMSESS